MSPIRVLDRSVAERIAAGEVIDRPASVVKELVENSLDAGATSVAVEVEGAGTRVIRVIDDGGGIGEAEVPLAFERFATSKIAILEDLDAVVTYGFRGEALPSIAAISRVTLTTRAAAADHATRIVVTGGAVESTAPHGAPPGTTVEVARLFFNTPARIKFLKTPARERSLIADVVQRLALARPDVAFRLVFDGREAAWWPRTTARARVADVLGTGGADDLIPVEGALPTGRLTAWLGRPERARPNRGGEHVLVNGRPVQSALLRRAVEQGYAQLLPVGRYPTFVLRAEVHPGSVDVNVHPRKLEVRFRDEGRLFGAVAALTRDALLASPLVRRVVLPPDGMPAGGRAAGSPAAPSVGAPVPLALEARESAAPYGPAASARLPVLKPLGQLLAAYIVAEGPDGLYLIDQHAAHERVLYERLVAAHRAGRVTGQGLAVPLTVELTPAQMALLVGHADHLATLGYQIEPFGARTALLRAVPALSAATGPDALLRSALAALADDGGADDTVERLAIATACHTAVRAGDRLSPEATAALLADLAQTADPFTCFHGRPTLVAVTREQLERWFLRR